VDYLKLPLCLRDGGAAICNVFFHALQTPKEAAPLNCSRKGGSAIAADLWVANTNVNDVRRGHQESGNETLSAVFFELAV